MSYTHLTTAERVKIETYLELGMSIRSIARRLGRQPSTVSREIRRNPDYVAERAQKRYEKAKTNCGAKTKLDDTMRRTIVEKRVRPGPRNRSSAASTQEKLPSPPSTDGSRGTDRRAPDRAPPERETSKADRDARAHQHRTPHLATAARGQGAPDVRALGARHRRLRTREVEGVRRDVHRAEEPVLSRPADRGPHRGLDGGAIHAVHGAFPDGTFETATTDRGKEFSGHERIQASLGVPMYFADPYASWQRGSNENANGLLREFFPKGTDFAQVAHDELADALAKINGRPRKCLNWKTAHEVFTEEVLRLI